jgi:hypothetical protein
MMLISERRLDKVGPLTQAKRATSGLSNSQKNGKGRSVSERSTDILAMNKPRTVGLCLAMVLP